ncbi:MAG: hypothetical protein AAB250_16810, partial [Bdellovibrionota bacterium]
MIRVNLLRNTGLDAAVVGGPGIQVVAVDQQKLAIIKLVVILLVPGALYVYESINISNLQQAASQIERREIDAALVVSGEDGGALVEETVRWLTTDPRAGRAELKRAHASLTIGAG